ncbi:MAG: long-chain fatty acid--CoA ligase [Myxococcales bacterium]|nr:long-chain fatty acid--CoA ligase [Myxococcales bacterium]
MSLNLAAILHDATQRNPEKTAIRLGGMTLTYGALDGYARKFAGALAELGLKRGQHVALMLPNVPHFTIAYYGGQYAACPIVPLNVLLTADEIAYHLEDSDAVALVVWEGFYEAAKKGFARVPTCQHLIVAKADLSDTADPEGAKSMIGLIGSAEPVAEVPATMPDDTAVILYTSGTTGRPKGAELTHFNLFYNSEYVASHLIPLKSDDVMFAVLPLFHSFGQTVIQNGALHAGATILLQARFEALETLKLLSEHKVTVFAGVPTMYFALLNHPEADAFDLSSLRYCMTGGAAMPVEVMNAFDAKYKVNILEGYGLSETSPVASFNVLDRPKKAGSIGIPIRGVDFRLLDNDGNVVTDLDTPGEICIKGHNVMKGYYKRPEATAQSINEGGWFRSGDIGTRDSDGFYFIVDRKKDMIIRGGFNVYPREIEETLYAHPAIAEAAVIGIPDERSGEEVKAVLACKPGQSATPEEIIAYCKEHLAAYKYPRVVEFVDALPKGPTGKILKRALRES